jgi:hypothetical protein
MGISPIIYQIIFVNLSLRIIYILTIFIFFSGIFHYDTVEKFFKNWEKEHRTSKDIKYPEIILMPPKDDIAEYTSTSVDQW